MHKSRIGALVIDCQTENLDQAAEFWTEALGLPPRQASGDADERYRELRMPPGEPQVLLQKVDHPSRVHLDIETDNIEREVERLRRLGAAVIAKLDRWTVLESPTGHRFCVVQPQRPDFDDAIDINYWE